MESIANTMSTMDTTVFQSTGSTVFSFVMLVLSIVVMWKIFEKADIAGWKALIPFYNVYLLFKITWGNGVFALLLLIPIVDVIVLVMTCLKLAKAFGRGTGFGIGLFFLPLLFEAFLAFDESRYQGVPA